jgi:non-specific serine/threonine protein kinase
MTWLADDSRTGTEVMLNLPRVAPAGAAAVAAWLAAVRRAARLDHPGLARVLACDVHEQWPYVVVDRRAGVTLDEWLAEHPKPTTDEAALWMEEVLRALAFAHDAGVAHLDPQFHTLLVNERGQIAVMALSVAHESALDAAHGRDNDRAMPLDPSMLRAQRSAAERDVLACGLLLHRLLADEPPLGVADAGQVMLALAPHGREFVRCLDHAASDSEPLRAIVNRSTAGQIRLRYRNARTFLGALNGWREALSDNEAGPVALLLDRLRTVGHLPALPGLGPRVQRVTAIESQRTDEIAAHLLPDLALSFELLRTINTAQVQGTQISGNGPVLTLRRVVALIGVDGVRLAANSLRAWPGPLDDAGAKALLAVIDRARLAGHTAQALRPAGYDGEVVYLIAALQNLGRLMLRYHFAEEAEQIVQLMQPAPAAGDGPEQPGLDQAAASYAVLGVDVETFGFAVARHWGLGDEILHMIRRLPVEAPVRKPDSDADLLRIVASAANEVVDVASTVPAKKLSAALNHVSQRYARVLRLNPRHRRFAPQAGRAAQGRRDACGSARSRCRRSRVGRRKRLPAGALGP